MYKKKTVYISPQTGTTLHEQIKDCISAVEKTLAKYRLETGDILKQTIFIDADGNDDFYRKKRELTTALKSYYGDLFPPTGVVGQPPEDNKLPAMELVLFTDTERRDEITITRKDMEDVRYLTLQTPGLKEVFASGLTAGERAAGTGSNGDSEPLFQAKEAFERMKKILDRENLGFGDVVRQWNYIENITGTTRLEAGEKQNYQIFNDVRSIYYGTGGFKNGYPAATGIGMNYGGTVLEFIAVDASASAGLTVLPVENPDQVDAHRYSQDVLVGESLKELKEKTTPKFERAKLLVNARGCLVYISGTASIRGQKTMAEDDVETQTRITIENIAKLVSPENLVNHGAPRDYRSSPLSYCRVYVKNKEDLPKVKKICEDHYKDVPTLYLLSDICRPTLLVEIEGAIESV
jgi:enamine deaminase RidA (YjgF/YER057c/UK114 family)